MALNNKIKKPLLILTFSLTSILAINALSNSSLSDSSLPSKPLAEPSTDNLLPKETQFSFGKITSAGKPVAGAMITFSHGPHGEIHSLSVFSDDQGRYLTPDLAWNSDYSVRARRVGWEDSVIDNIAFKKGGNHISFDLKRIVSLNQMSLQLPGNYWMQLVLERIDDKTELYEFKQQCTYCHQQGTSTTRSQRSREEWQEVIQKMGRYSAIITHSLKEKLPDILMEAYDPKNALPKLAAYESPHGPLPLPSLEARKAVIEEWNLGGSTSGQHDMIVYHADGSIWSVDGSMDTLHKISFDKNPDGIRVAYKIPHDGLELGGVYHQMRKAAPRPTKTYVQPHSLQTAPDGRIWLTLAAGNRLAGFDPKTEKWEMVDLEQGINPHTLRFDKKGRLWYTITATIHVGMFNPVTKEQKFVRLPSPDLGTELILRMTPFLISHAHWFNLAERGANSDGVSMPMPYGIDISPIDGSVWYSQLNFRHIGRIDPETLEVTSIETPFDTPRRLRFDSKGGLWIPSYSEGTINLYDPNKNTFKSWVIPVEPIGTATPYALAIDKSKDHVWINGTQSDTMIRFEPETEQFTIYPLPTQVTFTREIEFDEQNRVWTSHSNFPAWHVEGGIPKVTRIDPYGAPSIDESGVFNAPSEKEEKSKETTPLALNDK